jgi:hypothetical protein
MTLDRTTQSLLTTANVPWCFILFCVIFLIVIPLNVDQKCHSTACYSSQCHCAHCNSAECHSDGCHSLNAILLCHFDDWSRWMCLGVILPSVILLNVILCHSPVYNSIGCLWWDHSADCVNLLGGYCAEFHFTWGYFAKHHSMEFHSSVCHFTECHLYWMSL